jgi:serine protease Do
MRMLPKIVADTAVDKDVEVVILRKGQKMALKAKVGRLEDGEKKLASVEDKETPKGEETSPVLGLTLKPLDEQARAENDIAESVKGVLIDSVAEGSQAFEKGIKAGDVIVEIGQEAVASPEAAAARIEKLRKEGRKSALVMVSSKTGDIRFVVLRIEG